MATDNTPPRLRLIATIGIIAIITLVGLNFVFKSYYAFMTDEAQREKNAPRALLAAQVAADQASFAGAKMPLDQAIGSLKAARSELIEPKPSDDLGAMTGWAKLPRQAPLPAPSAAPLVDPLLDAGARALAADVDAAAVAALADAGAAPLAADAAAPVAPRAPDHKPNAPHPAPKH
jgi:hypothetical protein